MWDKVEKILKKHKINQELLARKCGVTSGTISDFKNGRIKKPSFELMVKIANALDVSLDEFK